MKPLPAALIGMVLLLLIAAPVLADYEVGVASLENKGYANQSTHGPEYSRDNNLTTYWQQVNNAVQFRDYLKVNLVGPARIDYCDLYQPSGGSHPIALSDNQNITNSTSVPQNTWTRLYNKIGNNNASPFYELCTVGSFAGISEFKCYASGTDPAIPVDFSGTPTDGIAPMTVTFTISNFAAINATGPFWAFGDGQFSADTDDTITHVYQNPGTYTVAMGYYNSSGTSGTVTKTNYIHTTTNPGWNVISCVNVKDIRTAHSLMGANVSMRDNYGSNWSNTTTASDGKAYITTNSTATFNAYSRALGYQDQDHIGYTPKDNTLYGCYEMNMVPNGYFNVSPGNVTLYVRVTDKDTKAPIPLATADITIGGLTQSKTTNDAGMATWTVPNRTWVTVGAVKAGYSGAITSVYTSLEGGGGGAMVGAELQLSKITVTPTPTPSGSWTPTQPTTLPTVCNNGICVTVTPTPSQTILPGCEPPNENSAACTQAHADFDMGLISQQAEMLIGLCIAATVMFLLAGMLKAF